MRNYTSPGKGARRMPLRTILLVGLALQALAVAQAPTERHSTEWAAMSGGAADLPGGARGGSFWAAQLRWGHVLTSPYGPGPLRGTLEYAFEAVPAMVLRESGSIFGAGFNPLMLQYNFATERRFVPFIQVGGGTLWTTRDFPPGTSSFNFTPQGGIGAYWLRADRTALVFGARFHHISNAGISQPNPGHNALYLYGGFSWWR